MSPPPITFERVEMSGNMVFCRACGGTLHSTGLIEQGFSLVWHRILKDGCTGGGGERRLVVDVGANVRGGGGGTRPRAGRLAACFLLIASGVMLPAVLAACPTGPHPPKVAQGC